MDDGRPRRLLSFDASQVSFSRLGKALYSAAAPSTPDAPEDAPETSDLLDHPYQARGPVIAMAAAPDHRHAVVAMKGSLEIIEPDRSRSNVAIKLDKRYLPTSVQWGRHQSDSVVALATSGGSLALYNVIPTEIRQTAQTATLKLGKSINSLSFLPNIPGNRLLGGASDGSVRLWDLRQGIKHPVAVFGRPGDIAREAAYQPGSDFKFAAVYDSGIVQRWDVRRPAQADLRINNAQQQGLTLTWHPHMNYLATGGRDHVMNVWNMSTATAMPDFSITTPGSVAKARWIPTVDSKIDQSIIVTSSRDAVGGQARSPYLVWRLSNPHLPVYAVERHSEPITEILPVSAHKLWSASRDSTVASTDLRNEPEVAQNLPPVLVTWSAPSVAALSFRPPQTRIIGPNNLRGTYSKSLSKSTSPSPDLFGPSEYFNSDHRSEFQRRETFPSQIVEIGMPLDDRKDRKYAAEELVFDCPHGWSLGDACRHNSRIMGNLHRFRSSQMWNALAVAVDTAQAEFLATLSGAKADVARRWFAGELANTADAIAEKSTEDVEEEEDDDDDSLSHSPRSFGKSPRTFGKSPRSSGKSPRSLGRSGISRKPSGSWSRPTLVHPDSDKWQLPADDVAENSIASVKGSFHQFLAAHSQLWHLIPMLRECSQYAITVGKELNTTALLILFREIFDWHDSDLDAEEVLISTIRILQRQAAFVPAAKLLSITQLEGSEFEQSSPDTSCHRCGRALSDNAAFVARDDAHVGFWYCSHCRRLLRGCALCNEPVKGLGVVVLDCGHVQHRECWHIWMSEGVMDCPAGCGQPLQ